MVAVGICQRPSESQSESSAFAIGPAESTSQTSLGRSRPARRGCQGVVQLDQGCGMDDRTGGAGRWPRSLGRAGGEVVLERWQQASDVHFYIPPYIPSQTTPPPNRHPRHSFPQHCTAQHTYTHSIFHRQSLAAPCMMLVPLSHVHCALVQMSHSDATHNHASRYMQHVAKRTDMMIKPPLLPRVPRHPVSCHPLAVRPAHLLSVPSSPHALLVHHARPSVVADRCFAWQTGSPATGKPVLAVCRPSMRSV